MEMRITEFELGTMIILALIENKPFAVARYGDGEYAVCYDCHLTDNCYMKHLGYVPKEKERNRIRAGVLDSINGLDAIGITTLKENLWGASRVYFEDLSNMPVVSLDFHSYFLKHGILDTILKRTKKLLYISGHEINFARFSNIESILHLEIPLQVCKYKEERKYYPEYFNNTMEAIKKLDLTGCLCLVGAGFVGKPFMMALKNQGGVVVDLGSNMDRLAGYVIRGPEGRTANISLKYKL